MSAGKRARGGARAGRGADGSTDPHAPPPSGATTGAAPTWYRSSSSVGSIGPFAARMRPFSVGALFSLRHPFVLRRRPSQRNPPDSLPQARAFISPETRHTRPIPLTRGRTRRTPSAFFCAVRSRERCARASATGLLLISVSLATARYTTRPRTTWPTPLCG